jgi:uncharacterized damage-inducible protein DinB
MLDELKRLFAYDAWANRETLASLERTADAPEAARKRMAHVVGTEWLWLSRLREKPSPLAVWPPLDLAECGKQLPRLAAAWRKELGAVSEASLGRRVTYVNSKGEIWENGAGDILMHAILHSVYHRGQIASDLRAAGFEPAYTDFIHAVRKGFVG